MFKSTLVIFYLAGILFSCSNTEPLPNIIAFFTESEIIIDGLLTESVWQKTESAVLRQNKSGQSVRDTTLLTEVKTAYDQNYLYIAFICNDPDIWGTFTNRDQHLWTEEAVEVFIDTNNIPNTYLEIEVSPKNVLFDSYIVDPIEIDIKATKEFNLEGIRTAVSVDGSLNDQNDRDLLWVVEIAIPLKELVDENYLIIPGKTEWRINFYRIERDRSGESIGYAWSPTGARFHKPAAFGILGFGSNN